MAIYDSSRGGYRVFVGDLGSRVGKYELEREFQNLGPILDVWVARNPPGFAFLVYKYQDDAEKCVKKLHGSNISAISWRPVLVVEEAGVLGENHRPDGIVCGRRVRVEHAVPYDEHRKDKSSKRRKPNYRSYSRTPSRSRSRSRSRRRSYKRSRSRSRRRSRSRSRDRKSKSSKRKRSYSKSKSKSRSRSRDRKSSKDRSSKSRHKSKSRSRSRSRSGSPKRKSLRRSRSGSRNISKSPERKSKSPQHNNVSSPLKDGSLSPTKPDLMDESAESDKQVDGSLDNQGSEEQVDTSDVIDTSHGMDNSTDNDLAEKQEEDDIETK